MRKLLAFGAQQIELRHVLNGLRTHIAKGQQRNGTARDIGRERAVDFRSC